MRRPSKSVYKHLFKQLTPSARTLNFNFDAFCLSLSIGMWRDTRHFLLLAVHRFDHEFNPDYLKPAPRIRASSSSRNGERPRRIGP